MKTAIMAAVVAGVTLAGCQDPNAPGRNTVGGALLGAGTGALLGTLAGGDDRRNALIGAGIGLVAGSAIGNYLDRQEQDLRRDLRGTGADIRNTGDRLIVTMPDRVTFATDSARIRPEFRSALDDVAATLREYQSSYLDVIGHTDSTGSAEYNQRLSERRAEAVANYLSRRGVFDERIVAIGRGEEEPIATNATQAGRAANRRVELVITPAQREASRY